MHIPAYVTQAGWRHRSAFQCDVYYFEPYVLLHECEELRSSN